MLRRWLEAIRREDHGQDLIEYTLLLAFLALASAGLFMHVGNSGAGVWASANTTIAGASSAASGATPDATPPSGGGTGDNGGGGGHHGDHDGRH